MKTLPLAALCLLLPALSLAGEPASPPRTLTEVAAREKAEKAQLRAKEKRAVDEARADQTLSASDKKAQVKRVHEVYRAERRRIEAFYDHERAELRKERQARRQADAESAPK